MPFIMRSFEGKLICGKRGGLPFLNVTRPDPESEICPNGTSPCSNHTSIENTICYNNTLTDDT